MKGRVLKPFGLIAILALGLVVVTGVAFATPAPTTLATGQDDVCPHDENGWSSHQEGDFEAVQGADEYCAKGGSAQSQGCDGYLVTGSFEEVLAAISAEGACGLSHWSYHMPEEEPETDPASVSLELGSCRWSEEAGSLTPLYFDISGEGTFSINGQDFTESGSVLLPPGDYGWTFVPAEGYHLEGSGSGNVEAPACEPPAPGEASATLAPFCGEGVNVTLANAVIFVQFGDQDPVMIDENGSYPLELGDYIAWAEAAEGFEFPEGAITRWEFSIERCPTRHEEPPTGPLDSIPLSTALPIAASGLTGLALLGSALRRKRH